MLVVKVAGGTNAGHKQPLRAPRQEWRCPQGHVNRGYVTRCLTVGCNRKRA